MIDQFDDLVLFSRYLFRLDKIRILFEKEIKRKKNTDSFNETAFLYHALLYVCIEAYNQYKFSDKVLDFLLGEKYQNQILVLKRMRNSIFHPDGEIYGSRQKDYINASDKILKWAFVIQFEFNRFVYTFAEDHGFPKIGNQIRKTIKEIIGWIPEYGLPIKLFKSQKKMRALYKYRIRDNPGKKLEYNKQCQEAIEQLNKPVMDAYKKLIISEEINLTTAST